MQDIANAMPDAIDGDSILMLVLRWYSVRERGIFEIVGTARYRNALDLRVCIQTRLQLYKPWHTDVDDLRVAW